MRTCREIRLQGCISQIFGNLDLLIRLVRVAVQQQKLYAIHPSIADSRNEMHLR